MLRRCVATVVFAMLGLVPGPAGAFELLDRPAPASDGSGRGRVCLMVHSCEGRRTVCLMRDCEIRADLPVCLVREVRCGPGRTPLEP